MEKRKNMTLESKESGKFKCSKCKESAICFINGKPLCEKHRKEIKKIFQQEYHPKYYSDHRDTLLEKQKNYAEKRRNQLIKKGLCAVCGEEREDKKFKLCEKCRKIFREKYVKKPRILKKKKPYIPHPRKRMSKKEKKEKRRERSKQKYQRNKVKIKKGAKKYYRKNREEIILKSSDFYYNNRDKILKKRKKDYQKKKGLNKKWKK